MEPPPHRRRAPVKLTRPERFELPTLWFEARWAITRRSRRPPPQGHASRLARPRAPENRPRQERFELPTLWFEARCSIQLSYGRNPPLADGFWFVVVRIWFWNEIRTTTNEIRKFCESKILCEEWDSN